MEILLITTIIFILILVIKAVQYEYAKENRITKRKTTPAVRQISSKQNNIKPPANTINPTNDSVNEITEPYFNTINDVVEKTVSFYKNLNNNESLQSAVNITLVNVSTEVNSMEFAEKIRLLLLFDITKCYIELGYPVNLKSKEGFGLILLLSRIMRNIEPVKYSSINVILTDSIVKIHEDFIKQSGINTGTSTKFYLSQILAKYDTDLQKQYHVLLYRFASVIAKADGVISETEQQWLSELLKLSDNDDFETSPDKTPLLPDEFDPAFEEAAKVVVQNQIGSTSLIQRKLSLGYNRAGRVMEQLEVAGIVGQTGGSKPRQVLITSVYELNVLLTNLKSNANKKNKTKQHKEKSEQVYPTLKSDSQSELKSLIGLASVKAEISTLVNFLKIQKERQSKGLKTSQPSYHCVFTGNPGTGKTTVARIVAEIYKELNILKKGHLIETDRSGLVAEYVGQTAVKTNKVIDSALDGVLFIDEAYSIVGGGDKDYGKEAIATLLKRMEDDRERLIVILAGYTSEMKEFINSNPGLQSRFNRYIDFPDYSAEELYQIYELNLKKFDYTISSEAGKMLKEYFQTKVSGKDNNFGNARFVRNFFEKTLERQANRLAKETNLTINKLSEITIDDIKINK
jgi:SpoVK/Ycf46/Vps4 family AAA+-type ATPase